VTAWAAAAFVVLVPDAARVGAVAAWLLAVAAVAVGVLLGRPRKWLAVATLCFAVAGGVCTHVAAVQPAREAAGAVADAGGRALEAEATVTGRLDPGPSGDVWFDATAHVLRAGSRSVRGDLPIRVGVGSDDAHALRGVDLGARIRVSGAALPPDPGAREVVTIRATTGAEVLSVPTGVWAALWQLRTQFAASAAHLPGPGATLIPGLAVGDTAAVDATLDEAMTSASLSHLTAVSGANCAIVVGLAFGFAALCGARRGVRVAAGMGALVLFVLLVTPEPSVVRAAAMAAIAMLALALGRAGSGLAVLSMAVAVLLVLDPWLALTWGFALSVAATASLLVLAGPLALALGRGIPRPLALAVAVPLAAQLACAPLLILLDPHVPVLGVVANMLAGPAAPVATVVGLLACLAAPVPVLQEGLVALAWVPASWIAGVAEVISGIPAQRLPWLDGPLGVGTLAVLCAAVTAVLLIPPGRVRGWRMLRAAGFVVVAAAGGLAAGQAALVSIAAPWTVPVQWQVAMCDVGQGDAVLLRSGDAVALVDTGPDPEPLRTCLDRFAVSHVDVLVLTHFDADHSGGVDAVLGRVGEVWHGPPDTDGARALAALEAAGASRRQVTAGDTGSFGEAHVRVFWPAASVRDPGNDASVAMDVGGAGLPTMLLLGDLSEEAQTRMRGAAPLTGYDIVKVAHHGSADQDAALYDEAGAHIALIPVGRDNDYGHPRETLLDLLQADGARIARTDTDGAVAVWRDGETMRLWRERSVSPAG
jgi:competence protein ComEC